MLDSHHNIHEPIFRRYQMATYASERLNLRTTPHTKAIIEKDSSVAGVSMSNFVIQTAYQHAVELLNDTQKLKDSEVLDVDTNLLLTELLDSLPKVSSYSDDIVSIQRAMRNEW